MPTLVLPDGAAPARQPTSVRPQIVTPNPAPPDGEGWLHEIKHDGHRLIAIVDGGGRLSLVSRNGYDRTEAFGAPFVPLAAAGHEMVIDGEIAALTLAASRISTCGVRRQAAGGGSVKAKTGPCEELLRRC